MIIKLGSGSGSLNSKNTKEEIKKQPVAKPKKKAKVEATPIVDIVEEIKPIEEEDIEELLKEFETLEK